MQFKQYLSLFKIRNLIFLILSGTVSQFGDRLTHMLLITLIGITASGKVSAFSVASLTFTLPVIVFSPLIGILVDHWSRRYVMIRAHIIQAFILATTPFLINVTHSYLPFWIIITLFFAIDIFNNTAKPALMPHLVAHRKLLSANSLDQFLARFATVAGMVIGGFLIIRIGWQWGFIFNASMHFTAGMLILGIAKSSDIKPTYISHSKISINNSFTILVNDVKEIIALMKKDKIVLIVLGSYAVMTFIASVSYTILIFLVQQILNWGTQGVGIMSGILALGMIIGALALGVFRIQFNKLYIVITGLFLYGLLFLIGPFFISRILIIVIALFGGIIFSLITVAQNTILQEQVTSKIRGRIFGIKEFFCNITFILTAILIGVISDLTSYKIVLFGVGIILVFLSVLTFLSINPNKRPLTQN
jgi:MFS family permease